MIISRVIGSLYRYRSDLGIWLISGAVGAVVGRFLDVVFDAPSILDRVTVGFLTTLTFLMLALILVVHRRVFAPLSRLHDQVNQIAGWAQPTEYGERREHFAEEKTRIVDYLVRTEIPRIVNMLNSTRGRNDDSIGLIVDSGTTFEQFFPKIRRYGLGPRFESDAHDRLQIYTNSVSGTEQYCKATASTLRDNQLHLFGGVQMDKYRAVQGDLTLRGMRDMRAEFDAKEAPIIGLMTANWFLVGRAYNRMIVCSSEPGHLEFKRTLCEIADYVVIACPLGKMLKLDSVAELNDISKRNQKKVDYEPYDGFEIDDPAKRTMDNTFLVTTHRTRKDSVLYLHSADVVRASKYRDHSLYTYTPTRPSRALVLNHRGSRGTQIEIEMPHEYLRSHARPLLQIIR